MTAPGSSAVVLGASMSGLLAARALSPHFDRVTIVERDTLPGKATLRKGVPQAAHAHGLLASGYRILDAYFPELMDELVASGAPRGDVSGDFLWFLGGYWKRRQRSGLPGITVSRPFFEAAVRRKVRALDAVTVLDATEGVRPAVEASSSRVRGLVVRPMGGGGERTLDADLVVDASGRGSHSPRWLEELGFGRPEETSVRIDVGYATRTFRRRPGDLFHAIGALVSAAPARPRLGAVLAAEGDRWIVTLGGMLRDYPPTDDASWREFAASLPDPVVHDLVSAAPPLSDAVTYRFAANQRRFYGRMRRFPGGYLVMGDAACSFDPIYGQGMSVAALEARVLDDCLTSGQERLAHRYFTRARRALDGPWSIATGEDLRLADGGRRREFGARVLGRYMDRVNAVASVDATVCRRFFEVINLLAPPASLLKPSVVRRVLTRRVPAGPGSPARGSRPA